MPTNTLKSLFAAALLFAPALSPAESLYFQNTKAWRQIGPETIFYLGGETNMFFVDGFWNLSGCGHPSQSIIGPNLFCPLGTTGFIAQGDIDEDGENDQGSFWSIAEVVPAQSVEPFRPDLFRLLSAPPSGFTQILRGTDGDVSAIFDVSDSSVVVWYNVLGGSVDDYEITQYQGLRSYGAGKQELERHYWDVPWGPYKFVLPGLVPNNSRNEPGDVIYGVDHLVTPDAHSGRGAVPQGWRNINDEYWEDGALEFDPRTFFRFEWGGLTSANTIQGDTLRYSMQAHHYVNADGIEATAYVPDSIARGTVTGLSCFNTITTDINLDNLLEEGKIYELTFTSGRLAGTEDAVQYPVTSFGDSGDISVLRVVSREEGYTWEEARDAAESAGGRLAVLNTQEKIEFVNEQLLGAGLDTAEGEWPSMWIGLSDSEEEGVWQWNTGETLVEQPPSFQDIGSVADALAPFEVNTFGSTIDTELGLYDADGNLVLSNDDVGEFGDILQSQLDFPTGLEQGFYFLAVCTFDSGFDQSDFDVFAGGPGGPYALTHPDGVATGELGAGAVDWYRLAVGSPVEGGTWEVGSPTVDPPENDFDFAHILGGVAADGSAPVWFDEEGTVELEALLLEIPLLNSNEIVLPSANDLTGGVVTGSVVAGGVDEFTLETNRNLGDPECLVAGQTYRLEITSGALAGEDRFPITLWDGLTLSTEGAVDVTGQPEPPLPFGEELIGTTFVLTPENVNATFTVGYVGRHFLEASDALGDPSDFSLLVRGGEYRLEILTGELAGTSDSIRNWGFPTNAYLETETDLLGSLESGDTFSINLISLPGITVSMGDQFVIGQTFEDWVQDKYDAGEMLAVDFIELGFLYEIGVGEFFPGFPNNEVELAMLEVDQGLLGPLYAVARPDTIVFPPYPIQTPPTDRNQFIVGTLDGQYELGPFFFNPSDSVDAHLEISRSSSSSAVTYDVGSYSLDFRVRYIDTYEGFALLGGLEGGGFGADAGFPFGTPSSERATDYDFDRDGASNLLEYALGSDVANAQDRPTFEYALDEVAGGCTATLTKRPFTGTSLEYFFEYSTDLRTWTTILEDDPIFEIVQDDETTLEVSNLADFPGQLAAPACFLRVRVINRGL